jgi:hypothetical protein
VVHLAAVAVVAKVTAKAVTAVVGASRATSAAPGAAAAMTVAGPPVKTKGAAAVTAETAVAATVAAAKEAAATNVEEVAAAVVAAAAALVATEAVAATAAPRAAGRVTKTLIPPNPVSESHAPQANIPLGLAPTFGFHRHLRSVHRDPTKDDEANGLPLISPIFWPV